MVRYRLARQGLMGPGVPINLTFSVTNVCQSRCKTCNIWEIYRNQPEKRHEELTLEEIEKIFQSMGHIYVFNISGGEPFLRSDIKEIIAIAKKVRNGSDIALEKAISDVIEGNEVSIKMDDESHPCKC